MSGSDWLWILAGYLSGSIPFALLIGLVHAVDIRKIGSGNVGATNVGRAVGRKWGFLCFGLDAAKGLAPVLVAGFAAGYIDRPDLTPTEAWRWLAVGAAAVLGHVFPIWLGFRGGKGVATAAGVLLGFWPVLTVPALAALATWIALAAAFGYISLASVGAAVVLPIYLIIWSLVTGKTLADAVPFLAVCGALAVLVVIRHRTNLGRLRKGTEPRFRQ